MGPGAGHDGGDVAAQAGHTYISSVPVIDRHSPLPLWAQVLDDLRRRIEAGEFTEGFPTDVELVEQYGVSRHTAREAVRRLQDDGVVTRERGRGTFVTTPTIEQGTGAIYSLFRSLESMGIEQRSDVLDLSEVTDPAVAERFGLPPDTPFVHLERVRCADDVPLAHDEAWLPASLARPLLDADFTRTALYDELHRRCGVRPLTGTERISAELPTDEDRRRLRIGARQPVFRIRREGHHGERMIEWRETVVRGDRYSFVAGWSPTSAYGTTLTADDRR